MTATGAAGEALSMSGKPNSSNGPGPAAPSSRAAEIAACVMVCMGFVAHGAFGQEAVQQIAELTHEPLREVSGITRSSYEGVFWVHNDSGDAARIFAITLDGKPVVPPAMQDQFKDRPWPGIRVLQASNVDWEDIAFADGRLYIADMGNNLNRRRDLGVYELAEPNPYEADQTRAIRFLPVRYPDQKAFPAEQWHFDCEAVFVDKGKLYFLTKHRLRGVPLGMIPGTKLYRLDSQSTIKPNVLTLVGRRADLNMPTAAELSPDGKRLAVLTYMAVWVFERPQVDDNWLAGKATRLALDRSRMGWNEAVTWQDDATLLIANEQRKLFRVAASALSAND